MQLKMTHFLKVQTNFKKYQYLIASVVFYK